jgi:transcriptional regulator with XRE-family HTH domain
MVVSWQSMGESSALAVVVGQRLRTLRENAKCRQDDLAAVARRWGLQWTRATVAGIETGRRGLSFEEFVILPRVLRDLRSPNQPFHDDLPFELVDILPNAGWIELSKETRVQAKALKAILQAQARTTQLSDFDTPELRKLPRMVLPAQLSASPEIRPLWRQLRPGEKMTPEEVMLITRDAARDTEQKAAANLDVPTLAIAIAARKSWGRSLTEERDWRVSEKASGSMTPRTVQALRGHITRELLGELRPFVTLLQPMPNATRSGHRGVGGSRRGARKGRPRAGP